MIQDLGRTFPGSTGLDAGDDASQTDEQRPAVELDQVFHVLQNHRRRDVLRYLSNASAQVKLSDLAERIAARECEKPVSELDSQERKRVYVALYQCHLPKMADTGVVRFDSDRGTIEPGPEFDQFLEHLPDE